MARGEPPGEGRTVGICSASTGLGHERGVRSQASAGCFHRGVRDAEELRTVLAGYPDGGIDRLLLDGHRRSDYRLGTEAFALDDQPPDGLTDAEVALLKTKLSARAVVELWICWCGQRHSSGSVAAQTLANRLGRPVYAFTERCFPPSRVAQNRGGWWRLNFSRRGYWVRFNPGTDVTRLARPDAALPADPLGLTGGPTSPGDDTLGTVVAFTAVGGPSGSADGS